MKASGSIWVALVLFLLLVFSESMSARRISQPHSRINNSHGRHLKSSATNSREISYMRMKRPDTLQVAGSSLPDCSHACGSCRPCRLVMVSFVCALIAEAETCPMAYKCMCNNKSYPVP